MTGAVSENVPQGASRHVKMCDTQSERLGGTLIHGPNLNGKAGGNAHRDETVLHDHRNGSAEGYHAAKQRMHMATAASFHK